MSQPGLILTPAEVLGLLPQRDPFLFVDEILEVDDDHIVARYRFRPDADFYRGHFPGHPVTPGVILLESLAQVGVVALGLYQIARGQGMEAVESALALFTDANVEFSGIVSPGDRVTIRAKKVFFRRGKIRSEAEMTLDDGTVVISGIISGIGVPKT
ncbi:MAG: beta-hydroxyacyl-ACP dehydratase [Gemmatimonadota bacterium]|nr:beta-hydroxyacyl-ACP dehydratase [Gemmatimonadota bacterium]